jgi:hypothetical protein
MGDAGTTPEPSQQGHDNANQCCAEYGWH